MALNDLAEGATIIIDGLALMVAIEKPQGVLAFGELTVVFRSTVLQGKTLFYRIEIVFERYYNVSIKSATGQRHANDSRPRRVIENRNVRLPFDWNNFWHWQKIREI